MERTYALRGAATACALALLAGCSSLGERLDESVKQAQAVNDRCELVADAFPIPESGEAFVNDLVERLKLRLAGLCPQTGQGSALCELIDLVAKLQDLRDQAKEAPVDVRARLEQKLDEIKPAADNVRGKRKAVQEKIAALRAAVFTRGETSQFLAACQKSVSRHDCAARMLAMLRKQEAAVEDVAKSLKDLNIAIRSFHDAVNDAARAMAADSDSTAATVRRMFDELRGYARAAESAMGAGQDAWNVLLGGNTQEAVREFFTAKISFKAADATLSLLERAVSRVDRMMDKIDDKTYAVSAIMVWWWEDDIQEQIDQFYARYVRDRLGSRTAVYAFARAACERLAAPPPANGRSSLVMPFLLQAFTNVEIEEEHLRQCADTPVGVKRNQGESCIAYAKRMTVGEHAQTLTPEAKAEQKERLERKKPTEATEQAKAAAERQERRRTTSLTFRAAEKSAEAPSDLETLVMRLKGESRARVQLGMAGLPIDEQTVRTAGEKAAGEGLFAHLERCAGGCSANGKSAVASAAPHVIDYEVNNVVHSYAVSNVFINNSRHLNIRPSPTAARADPVCGDLLQRDPRLRCTNGPDNTYTVRINQSFPSGAWSDNSVRHALRAVAEYAKARKLSLDAHVEASASGARFSCARLNKGAKDYLGRIGNWKVIDNGGPLEIVVSDKPQPELHAPNLKTFPVRLACANDAEDAGLKTVAGGNGAIIRTGNYFLSLLRAGWAAETLRAHSAGAIRSGGLTPLAATQAADGNDWGDRQLVLVLKERASGSR